MKISVKLNDISRQNFILNDINPLMPDPRNNGNFKVIFKTLFIFIVVSEILKKNSTYPPWGGREGHVL